MFRIFTVLSFPPLVLLLFLYLPLRNEGARKGNEHTAQHIDEEEASQKVRMFLN